MRLDLVHARSLHEHWPAWREKGSHFSFFLFVPAFCLFPDNFLSASCLRTVSLPAKLSAMTFAEKVQNHAARRLAIPLAHTPAQEIARYKDFLKVESHRVHLLHKRGESGR